MAAQAAEDNKNLLRRGTLAPNPDDIKAMVGKSQGAKSDAATKRTSQAISAASPTGASQANPFSPTSNKAKAAEMEFQ